MIWIYSILAILGISTIFIIMAILLAKYLVKVFPIFESEVKRYKQND